MEPQRTDGPQGTEGRLQGKTIAILATDGFEQIELESPRKMLEDAGARTVLVAPHSGWIQGFHHHDKADPFPVDVELKDAKPDSFDGLMLPGGALNPDQLRTDAQAVEFVRAFARSGKPIAAICHGPWTLVEADIVRGRTVTSWPSLKTDLRNAGATWVDREVVSDHGLVTSRKPDDIPAFVKRAIDEFAGSARSDRSRVGYR
jgi:protease I